MTYYHGSPVGNIKILNPSVSNHDAPFVYLSSNPIVALFYTAKIPFYPYGFSKKARTPKYCEYYEDALLDMYENKIGYIYECDDIPAVENPTNIFCAFVSRFPVKINRYKMIPNVYEELLKSEREGFLEVRRYIDNSEEENSKNSEMVMKCIVGGDLHNRNDDYAEYMKSRFTREWENTR